MYTPDHRFNTPNNKDAKIWRYMSLPKFLSLLTTEALFFSKVSGFDDQLEWTVPRALPETAARNNAARLEEEERYWQQCREETTDERLNAMILDPPYGPLDPETRKALVEQQRDIAARSHTLTWRIYFAERRNDDSALIYQVNEWIREAEETRDRGLVNCWYMSEHQSVAMWDLYSNREAGVAIQSTVGALIEAVRGYPEPIYLGQVRYIDFGSVHADHAWGHFSTYKRIGYEHEKELRAVMIPDADVAGGGAKVPVVPLNSLVEKVHINPRVSDVFADPIRKVASKFGLTSPIEHLDLRDNPR